VTATPPHPAAPADQPELAVAEHIVRRDASSAMTRGCQVAAATRTLEPRLTSLAKAPRSSHSAPLHARYPRSVSPHGRHPAHAPKGSTPRRVLVRETPTLAECSPKPTARGAAPFGKCHGAGDGTADDEQLLRRLRRSAQTSFGTLPLRLKMTRIALCPKSAVGPNMHGQPPSITAMPCWRPSVAPGLDARERGRRTTDQSLSSRVCVRLRFARHHTLGMAPSLVAVALGTSGIGSNPVRYEAGGTGARRSRAAK